MRGIVGDRSDVRLNVTAGSMRCGWAPQLSLMAAGLAYCGAMFRRRAVPASGLCVVVFQLVACGGGTSDPSTPVLATLSVSITKDTMRVGEAALAVAEGRDASGARMRIPEPTWTSSNPAVATVSYVGYVTAVGIGTTRILAATLGKAAEVTLHVVPTPVAGVLLGPTTAVLAPNETLRLSATPVDAAGRALAGRTVAWLSSDTMVVQVSEDGLVAAVGSGITSVSAISEDVYASARIRVSGPAGPVASVTVTPEAFSLSIGQTSQLAVVLEDAEGDLANDRAVTWTSSAPNVATVSAAGVVHAVAKGSATISASSEGRAGLAVVVVTDPADAVTIRVAEPVPNDIANDTLRVVASASAGKPIAGLRAKVVSREADLQLGPVGRGALAWLGPLNLTDLQYGRTRWSSQPWTPMGT